MNIILFIHRPLINNEYSIIITKWHSNVIEVDGYLTLDGKKSSGCLSQRTHMELYLVPGGMQLMWKALGHLRLICAINESSSSSSSRLLSVILGISM
jgi:hypothetical protein